MCNFYTKLHDTMCNFYTKLHIVSCKYLYINCPKAICLKTLSSHLLLIYHPILSYK